jgi:DNA excision repair protein ERCC-2
VSGAVFSQLRGGVLMSGTFHPVEMYAGLLGVPPARCTIRSYPSPFDPSRRLLLVSRDVTSAYAQRGPALYRRIAALIADTASRFRGNAAAFCPSYGFVGRVVEALRDRTDRPVLAENQAWTKEDRDAALRWLEDHSDPGGLLVGVLGGGLSEGVDYRDNLLRAVFIVGLPLTPPTVETKALQRYLSGKFGSEKGFEYAVLAPAASKLLQAAGRPIRSESDRAAILLLESRLLEPRYRRLFPEDFAYRESADLGAEVAAFLTAEEPSEDETIKTPALDGPAC